MRVVSDRKARRLLDFTFFLRFLRLYIPRLVTLT